MFDAPIFSMDWPVTALIAIGVLWTVVERLSAVTTTSSIALGEAAGAGSLCAQAWPPARDVKAVAAKAHAFSPGNWKFMQFPFDRWTRRMQG
jgi:hypothetical protein